MVQTYLVLLPSLVIALVCFIWVPDIPEQGDFDVENHYFESARWTLPLIALFLLLGVVTDFLIPNVENWAYRSLVIIAPAALLLGVAFSRHRLVHLAVFGASWLVFFVFMFSEA
jgi:hypothetical protein